MPDTDHMTRAEQGNRRRSKRLAFGVFQQKIFLVACEEIVVILVVLVRQRGVKRSGNTSAFSGVDEANLDRQLVAICHDTADFCGGLTAAVITACYRLTGRLLSICGVGKRTGREENSGKNRT